MTPQKLINKQINTFFLSHVEAEVSKLGAQVACLFFFFNKWKTRYYKKLFFTLRSDSSFSMLIFEIQKDNAVYHKKVSKIEWNEPGHGQPQ